MHEKIKRIAHACFIGSFLLIVVSLNVNSQGLNNLSVNIDASNKTVLSIIESLEKQTGYYFTFDSRLKDLSERVTLEMSDISIQDAIDTLFNNHSLTYSIIHNNIVIIPLKEISNLSKRNPENIKLKIVEITGIVKDQHSEKPLPYANIALTNSNIGTVANENGSFLLKLPDSLNQPVIAVSYMGYKNQYTSVSIASNEPLEIFMNKNVISLQEVIIRYQNPYILLTDVIKNIPQNYTDEPSGMQAYYREKVMRDEKYMVFFEAVLNIAKAPYSNPYFAERSKIIKGRKITNFETQDTVMLKIQSGINSMLQLDIVRNPPDFLSPDFYLKYDVRFLDMVSYNNELVYLISFKQKETIQEALFEGELYINQSNFSIVAANFEYNPQRIGKEQDMFVQKKSRNLKVKPVSSRYHVEYAKTNNKYHLNQVKGEVKFKVRKKGKWIASKYKINLEMAITNIQPGIPPHIRLNEKVKSTTVLAEESFVYDPDFWGKNNIITPESNLKETLEKIEKSIQEITLE